MSTSKKKGRLALKKRPGPATPVEAKNSTQNTILSMFKKQRDEKTEAKHESGSEGDVIITGVTHEKVEEATENTMVVSDEAVETTLSTETKGKVSKKKGRLSLAGNGKKDRIDGDSSSKIDDKVNAYKDNVPINKKVNKDKIQSKYFSPRYKLRKRNTVPVIEIASESDSDVDSYDGTGIEHISMSNMLLNDIPSSGSSDFQDISRSRKRKMSLKKSKTLNDIDTQSKRKKADKKPSGKTDAFKAMAGNKDKLDEKLLGQGKNELKMSKKVVGKKLIVNDQKVNTSASYPKEKLFVSSPKKRKSELSIKEENMPSISMEKKDKSEQKGIVLNKSKDKLKNASIASIKIKPHTRDLKQSAMHPLFRKKSSNHLSVKESTNMSDINVSKERKQKVNTNQENKNKDDDHDNDSDADKVKPDLKQESVEVGEVMEGVEETVERADGEEKTEELYKVPYYLENFRTILDSVLSDKENARLFDETDMAHVSAFNELTEPSQKLYVRLFSRKWAWLPMSKLKYPEISSDVPGLVDELHKAGLLHCGDRLDDLKIVLKILAAPELKLLAKSFHINNTGTKDKIIELLLKKSQQSSIATMFTGGAALMSTEKTMLNRALLYLGKVCILEESARAVFIRLLMLFSLYHTNFDEDSAGGGQNQLFQMLMANIGRVVYPTYTIDRQRPVFQDRTALVRFETALQFELALLIEMEKGRWVQAHEVYTQSQAVGASLRKDKHIHKWDSALPEFLRLYTAGSVYVRVGSLGVEILQRLKRYREAVDLLGELLAQDLYCVHHRGHWYERLALNLDAHLKAPQKSLEVVKKGLSDKRVHTGRRLALYERAKKICEAPKSKFADKMAEIDHEPVEPTPEVCIEGMVISDAMSMGIKYQFIMSGDTDQTTLCGVEELVLEHYKHNGYPEGLHAEGSIVSNLFVLLFWEVLWMPVPDVFHGPFQTSPLDLHTQDFYRNREPAIEERLQWIREAEEEELVSAVAETWEQYSGVMCQGITWEKFAGPETHQGLVRCMGGQVIAGMLERFVKNPRHTRSGFPDLTLWNTETKALKICEVKGPNDRLSFKQILWIDYLLKLGVDAEACYVKAVGSKRLTPSNSTS